MLFICAAVVPEYLGSWSICDTQHISDYVCHRSRLVTCVIAMVMFNNGFLTNAVYQFRSNDSDSSSRLTTVGYFALGNVCWYTITPLLQIIRIFISGIILDVYDNRVWVLLLLHLL